MDTLASSSASAADQQHSSLLDKYRNRHLTVEEAYEILEIHSNCDTPDEYADVEDVLAQSGYTIEEDRPIYNQYDDIFILHPRRNEEGEITAEALVEWYDAFLEMNKKTEMDEEIAWFFLNWHIYTYKKGSYPRYEELADKADELMRPPYDDTEMDEDNYYSHAQEVGVNGGSSQW